MKTYHVYVNNEKVGEIEASRYPLAVLAARVAYGRRCDVIGPK